jgi:hypothetical protein
LLKEEGVKEEMVAIIIERKNKTASKDCIPLGIAGCIVMWRL